MRPRLAHLKNLNSANDHILVIHSAFNRDTYIGVKQPTNLSMFSSQEY